MAIPSSIQSPSPDTDTPAELYRLATSAVATWEPPQPTTEQYRQIRMRIEPNRGWWQFQLPRMPWQATLALSVYAGVVGCGVIAIAIAAYFGAAR